MQIDFPEAGSTQAQEAPPFPDHFGYLDQRFEAELNEWRHWMSEDDFHPALWFLAIEHGKIVAFCICYTKAPGDPACGPINELGVLPAARRRGIGRALLHHAFAALRQRNINGAVLTVDSKNRNGAVGLYTRVGMHTAFANHTYIKELRPGVNLVTE